MAKLPDGIAEFATLLGYKPHDGVPSIEPANFKESSEEIAKRLTTDDPEVAAMLLEGARARYDLVSDRAESAERRATTLQGAVAIAGSVTVAGGALLLDSSKVHGAGWKLAFGLALVALAFSLIMTGYRAVTATSRLYGWSAPDPEDAFVHVGLTGTEIRLRLAADLFKSSGLNTAIADRKVAAMSKAAVWFTRALLLVVVLALLLAIYAVTGN
jgi:hypothetical protein